MKTETIKTFNGKILGTITTDSRGVSTATAFGGKVLGTHNNSTNEVKKFAGPVAGSGKSVLGSFFK